MKIIGLFLFWRKNTLPSISFKCAFWAALAWLLVGIFTELKTALIAGAAAAIVAAIRYSVQVRKTNAKLLKLVDGDKTKLAQLKDKAKAKGTAAAMMNELLLAAAEEADDHDNELFEEPAELSEEQREKNRTETKKLVTTINGLCKDGGYRQAEACDEAANGMIEAFEDGESIPDTEDMVSAFLPANLLNIYCEDYCNEDDHASLMEEFALATNGKWDPGECHSIYDEDSDKWILTHQVAGATKTWRFAQCNDWLNEKFLQALIAYTEERSGNRITVLNSEDMIDLVCLPPEIHAALIVNSDNDNQQQAA